MIQGGRDIIGDLYVSGSKNAGLALMAAALLASGTSTLDGIPRLSDIESMGDALGYTGARIKRTSESLRIDTTQIRHSDIPERLTRSLRGSILALGPLVARFGSARLCLPGGCAIGARPIEEHVEGLEKMGARVSIVDGCVQAHVPSGLHGAVLSLKTPSVTGTMTLVMAACLARGVTHINNAAREPEVVDLADCLISMGASVFGAGTDRLVIAGRDALLCPYRYRVMEDRIEAGTFLTLGALAGNPITVHGFRAEHQASLLQTLRASGAHFQVHGDSITVRKAVRPVAVDIQTGPYPLFPTDLQPQLMALLSTAQGTSLISEAMFEQRFGQAEGLISMGADICIHDNVAVVSGATRLSGATVRATDLRAGASLVMAAVAARGVTIIQDVQHVDRGYCRLESKLKAVGVVIVRVHDSQEA